MIFQSKLLMVENYFAFSSHTVPSVGVASLLSLLTDLEQSCTGHPVFVMYVERVYSTDQYSSETMTNNGRLFFRVYVQNVSSGRGVIALALHGARTAAYGRVLLQIIFDQPDTKEIDK